MHALVGNFCEEPVENSSHRFQLGMHAAAESRRDIDERIQGEARDARAASR
jgi:hypothetical protein